jgi:hypothetical protein
MTGDKPLFVIYEQFFLQSLRLIRAKISFSLVSLSSVTAVNNFA